MSPVDVCCLLFICVLVCCWELAGCYASGKVTKVCGSMEPHHRGTVETTPSPYSLETNTSTFSPTDRIQVILSGTSYFKGFLIEARDAADQSSSSAVGTFTLTNPQRTQLLTCNKHQGSAVSHTGDVSQREVVVTWTAPTNASSQVQFFVTVVVHYSKFWVKLPGPIIYQHGVPPLPPQSDSTPPPVHTSTASILPGPFTIAGCGQTKSCMSDPPGCDPTKDPHCFFLSMLTDGPDKTSVVFELSGPAEGYVSFALSWDRWMGNDDVYMCVKDGARVSVSAAFVSGQTHPEDESQSALSSVSWQLADGVIQCRFRRPVKLANQEAARYDLDQEYFLFVASGYAEHGLVWKHSLQPLISTHRKVITGPPEVLTGFRSPIIMKMHGALMLVAWMLTGSVGTFIASFYKSDWPNHSLLGQKIWFQVHRGLMVLTVTLTVVGFCLPFFYRKGWSKHAGVHPYLGCCVLALSLIQPIMAVIRPSPDSSRRYIFNWAHWGVGSVTEIIAVAAMFLGTSQSSLLLPQPLATHILIGYVTWLSSFRVLLLVHKYLYIKNSALVSDDTLGILCDQSLQGSLNSFIKSLLLSVVALGNAGLLLALLSFIAEI
ncbi:putative ferric-chelate reductase 1 isoform X1 [Acanthopagrus latus]|uniref:putative ferric-chelate reductase 1 isoform X1 n=1 Tax=Acanthopagrus latus TaxID=8177 RepID=UPI00187BDB91|nr:putative ferric-chelate reductase 1 isoform X1 [Acanthopagrus latus]XP_036939227.1 putative ferric-chelate reductase 1 isoform X1 [Acanthopagrus latus]